MMPSATVHLAGDLSLVNTHSSRFLPSNSTIASEGGASLGAPGVTTFGTGSQTSVSVGWPRGGGGAGPAACPAGGCCWATTGATTAYETTNASARVAFRIGAL